VLGKTGLQGANPCLITNKIFWATFGPPFFYGRYMRVEVLKSMEKYIIFYVWEKTIGLGLSAVALIALGTAYLVRLIKRKIK
jgi:hypothetical protein